MKLAKLTARHEAAAARGEWPPQLPPGHVHSPDPAVERAVAAQRSQMTDLELAFEKRMDSAARSARLTARAILEARATAGDDHARAILARTAAG